MRYLSFYCRVMHISFFERGIMSTIVKMLDSDIENAIEIGKRRTKEKINSEDTDNYRAGKENGKLLPDDTANARSNISECAVSYLIDEPWNMPFYPNRYHYIRKRFADVGQNTEVRTIRTDPRISITEKDRGRVVYGCAVSKDLREVEIFGSIKAEDAMVPEYYVEETYPNGDSYKGWRVPLTDLTPPPPLPKWLSVPFE